MLLNKKYQLLVTVVIVILSGLMLPACSYTAENRYSENPPSGSVVRSTGGTPARDHSHRARVPRVEGSFQESEVPSRRRIFQEGAATEGAIYQQRLVHSLDGIGKFYMGREIAQVMGHQGAGWLERPYRETEEQPSRAVNALNLEPTDVVADVGAGTGYLSFQIAKKLPLGKVLAVDIQPEMLDIISSLKRERNIANVEPVLSKVNDPNLPDKSVDKVLMVDAYHEFEYPREMMEGIVRALKPGGRVFLVEYRGENPFIPIKALHKMTQKQARKEMLAVGLVWLETKNLLPQQHLMVFEKPKN